MILKSLQVKNMVNHQYAFFLNGKYKKTNRKTFPIVNCVNCHQSSILKRRDFPSQTSTYRLTGPTEQREVRKSTPNRKARSLPPKRTQQSKHCCASRGDRTGSAGHPQRPPAASRSPPGAAGAREAMPALHYCRGAPPYLKRVTHCCICVSLFKESHSLLHLCVL